MGNEAVVRRLLQEKTFTHHYLMHSVPKAPKRDSQPLAGRVCLVTGASRGIGLAIAQAVAGAGATLVLVARDRKALVRVAKQLSGSSTPFAADVTRSADVKRLFASLRRRHRRLDILVNNAGVFTYKPFERTTLEDWRNSLEANLTSLFLTTQAALPLFRNHAEGPNGHIVNILSISSRQAFANCSAYCASKFGALGLTRVLAEELRSRRIRVTAILPGSTNTRMTDEFDFPVDRAQLVQPGDVAQAVLAVLLTPARANIDEVLITPSRGRL